MSDNIDTSANQNPAKAESGTDDQLVYIDKLMLVDHPYIGDACIDTQQQKKHIIITGPNGVGKSTFLNTIKSTMQVMTNRVMTSIEQMEKVRTSPVHCKLHLNSKEGFNKLNQQAVYAFFNAKRTTEQQEVKTVSSSKVKSQDIDQPLAQLFKQHLVNSRSQLAFAKDDGDEQEVKSLMAWFEKLDQFMSDIFECQIQLKFDRKTLDYKIESQEGALLDFNHLSEGYGAIINIVTEIIMRIEAIEIGNFSLPGIVLIDEVETHLHVKLQKKILRLLTTFFPNIQFIVTTHSPFVLTSLDDAIVFDMQTNSQIDSKEDLWQFSYEDILEGYFDTEIYSHELELVCRLILGIKDNNNKPF